ncbi:MAG: hypothetical protein R2911_16345 [Caldilineaceae bacterium]
MHIPTDDLSQFNFDLIEEPDVAPSLPIILLSTATGLASGILGLYVAYRTVGLGAPISAGVATVCLLAGLSLAAAILSILTDSRAVLANIGFSCGLILLSLLFFGLCSVMGALAAMIILFYGN